MFARAAARFSATARANAIPGPPAAVGTGSPCQTETPFVMRLRPALPRFSFAVPGGPFAAGFVTLAVVAAAVCGAFPVGVSVAAVFLFAGPHNWLEARYVLGRLPARTGKLWAFFVASAAGVVGLTAAFAALPWLAESDAVGPYYPDVVSGWCTLLVLWVAVLVWMRSRTAPRFDGGWVWAVPAAIPVTLVYVHPLLALVLLDRELKRSHRAWLPAYRTAVLSVPLLLLVLAAVLHDAPDLPGTDPLTLAVTRHSGGDSLPWVSTRLLVTAHTFLELVHYGVWVVLVPLVGMKGQPWDVAAVPAARRGGAWERGVLAVLAVGLVLVAALWVGFAADYTTTRSVYFTVALVHVLAEVPLLLRML